MTDINTKQLSTFFHNKTMNKFSEVRKKQTKGISLMNIDDIPWASYQDQFIVKILNSKDPLKDIADLKKEIEY